MRYSINRHAQSNGDHEIHKANCTFEPLLQNRVDLGLHPDDYSALQAGRRVYPTADGCAYCCPAIHYR